MTSKAASHDKSTTPTSHDEERPRLTIGIGGCGRAELIQLGKNQAPGSARKVFGLVAPTIKI